MFALFTLLLFNVAPAFDALAVDDDGAHAAAESAIEPVEEMSELLGNEGFDVAPSSTECGGI